MVQNQLSFPMKMSGGFHLHLLVFPYQFSSRIVALNNLFVICKWLVQKDFNIISASFQNLFVVVFYMKKNKAFTLISFAVLKWVFISQKIFTYLLSTEMRWMFISSTVIWVNGSDSNSVASRARSELTRSKCEWTRISTI